MRLDYSQLVLLLPLLLPLLAAATSHVAYEEAASDYVPLDKWLRQRDLHSCLANSPADILFAVDGSQSVGLTGFHLVVKSILVDTISRLKIGQNFVQVGVLVFSDQVSQVIPLGRYSDKLQLLRAVSNLAYVGSYTSVDVAVEGCVAELDRREAALNRTETPDVRERRKRIVVFLTDGKINHGSSFYLRDLLTHLHSKVTGLLALGLETSNKRTLDLLATDPTLVFDPTSYPDYQASLLNLLNIKCSDTCYKYEQQDSKVRQVIGTLVRYINYLIDNFVSFKRQEISLLDYVSQVNASASVLRADIDRTCGQGDDLLLEKIVDLQQKIKVKTNGSDFNGLSVDTFISDMIEKSSGLQRENFEASRKLTVERSRVEAFRLEEQRLRADFAARLQSRVTVREANEASLRTLDERIASYRQELLKIEKSLKESENASTQLTERLLRQESEYSKRLARMQRLAKTHVTLAAVSSGGSAEFTRISRQMAFCRSFLNNGETVLFAVRCGSGADVTSLFSRDETSFSEDAFAGLSSALTMYKSPFLRRMHTMGYFKEASLKFIVGGQTIGSLTMDTSRYELANIFSQTRVTTSYPWIASYVNSVYRSSLDQLRLRADSEFLVVFGDVTRFAVSGRCADLSGVFIVLDRPHRCFPDAVIFPQVYISASPYGGAFVTRVDEMRLVTDRLPTLKQLPTISTNDEQMSEVLLYVRNGAGVLEPLLMSGRFTAASALADVEDLNELSRHYKSSLLSKVTPEDYESIHLSLFDKAGQTLATLEFKGPFEKHHAPHGEFGEVGSVHESWSWFQPQYLHSSWPFDLKLMQSIRFNFHEDNQFFTIGQNLAASCQQRRYFLTVVDGATGCECFDGVDTPAIFFSGGSHPVNCTRMPQAHSLRVTGFFRRPLSG